MKFKYFIDISHSGKTLILEEAAKTMAQRENTRVVFIMALGEIISKLCIILRF